MTVPDALMFLTSQCPHCPRVLAGLADMVKAGRLAELRVVNLEQRPEAGQMHGVGTVPWVCIGPYRLTGLRRQHELEHWAARVATADGMAEYVHAMLKEGELALVLDTVSRQPDALAALLPIVANAEASCNVRLGAGAVLEDYAGTDALRRLLPPLGELAGDADARVRADACHYLALTGDRAACPLLVARLGDSDAAVREIAAEGLAALGCAAGRG